MPLQAACRLAWRGGQMICIEISHIFTIVKRVFISRNDSMSSMNGRQLKLY